MNEVTKIHLGRQAFTISVDAHHQLKSYLADIEKRVKDKDVMDEIELRIAELLNERGITGNKVILPKDVANIKERLGDPADFKGEEDKQEDQTEVSASRKLFRNTDNAMVAGVASGLAAYFGIDALIIRLIFVLIVFITFGWGILLYILLWLLIPEAKTSSDKLQMAGRAVTVSNLKDVVSNADIKGAAKRANASLAGPINAIFNLALKVVGLFFVLFGLSAIFALIAGEIYYLVNSNIWLKSNIFPIGVKEEFLLHIAVLVVGLAAVFIILIGTALFKRKWPIHSWVTGILVGLVMLGLAAGGALAGVVYPTVHDRYNANLHTTIRSESPFDSINIDNFNSNNINLFYSSKYYVSLNYFGHPNLNQIKTSVANNVLIIDSSNFKWNRNCQTLCLPKSYNLQVNVYAPDVNQLENQLNSVITVPAKPVPPLYAQ